MTGGNTAASDSQSLIENLDLIEAFEFFVKRQLQIYNMQKYHQIAVNTKNIQTMQNLHNLQNMQTQQSLQNLQQQFQQQLQNNSANNMSLLNSAAGTLNSAPNVSLQYNDQTQLNAAGPGRSN